MNKFYRLGLTLAVVIGPASVAKAGDEPLYEDAPSWVEPADIDPDERKTASPIVFLGQQARIEKSRLWTYSQMAVALDSPEALTQFGTLNAAWLPDKGDLIIHSAELLRGDSRINLLEDDKGFEVLRRERALESRMLDGVLTATMPLAGAQLGDILLLTYSVTLTDQALGEQVQWEAGLFAKPFPLENGEVVVSWPKDLPITRKIVGDVELAEPEEQGGYLYWRSSLPIDEIEDTPYDAPFRFRLPPSMQVTTYSDWASISRSMAPHYKVAGAIEADGELAAEIAGIAAASSDPLERAALALELVQDKISYLLNGLNGGNYLPQMPEETWANRYGDCKAKSVLLLAILRELGIESEVVLVRSTGGDALPLLGPMPANFDHMIVRAQIGGVSYWLDGTTSGGRIDTISHVPRFYYALPISDEGSDLVAMDNRPKVVPDQHLYITLDQRAGLRIPALVSVTVKYKGEQAAPWRAVAEMEEDDLVEQSVELAMAQTIGSIQLLDHSASFDDATGEATITAKGLQTTPWERQRAVYELNAPAQAARDVGFDSNRAKAAWREIPLNLNGPTYWKSDLEVLLPDEVDPFEIRGQTEVAETIGQVELASSAELENGRFILKQSMRSLAHEIPAAEIPVAKRSLARFMRSLPTLRSGKQFRNLWDYTGPDAKRLDPVRKAYDQLVADGEADDNTPFIARARFLGGVFDYKASLADVEAAIEIEESQSLYIWRGELRRALGDLAGAMEDFEFAETLEPDNSTLSGRIELLALMGRGDDALALAEEYRGFGENEMDEDLVIATAMGWAGDPEGGLSLLEDQLAVRPGDGNLLNAICWHAGTFDIMTPDRLETCVEAVEKANYSPAVLDSRALAHLRLGDLEKARADLDSVLLLEPELTESRLLRGIVRLAQGDKEARDDVDLALRMNPYLAKTYAAYGLEF